MHAHTVQIFTHICYAVCPSHACTEIKTAMYKVKQDNSVHAQNME